MALSTGAARGYATVTVDSTGDYSDALVLRGKFDLSVQGGTFSATIVVQRSWDGGTTWYTYISKTDNYEGVEDASVGDYPVLYRVGCPTTYANGTIVCRISGRENAPANN